MAEQKEEFWGFVNYEVTAAVLDLLSGLRVENKKHGHVLLKSLLTGLEEKACGHTIDITLVSWNQVISTLLAEKMPKGNKQPG